MDNSISMWELHRLRVELETAQRKEKAAREQAARLGARLDEKTRDFHNRKNEASLK